MDGIAERVTEVDLPRPGPVGRPNRRRRDAVLGYSLLLPNLVLLSLFAIYPVLSSFVLSLQRIAPFGGQRRWVGLENYARLWEELVTGGDYWQHVKVSALYLAGTVPAGIAVAVLVAVALTRVTARMAGIYQVLIVLPIVISSAVAGIVFRWMLNPLAGYVNWMLSWVGIDGPNWLAEPDWALVSVIAAVVWRSLGFNVIVALAGVQAIPAEYHEAADIDGAGAWRKLWNVTIPLLSPTLFFLFIINAIASLKTFGEVSVLTAGGPGQATTNLVYALYQDAFVGTPMRGLASAQAYVLAIVILAVAVLQYRGFSRQVTYER